MNHFTNQFNGSHRGHSLMGRAMLRRFALFPIMLLMLLFLPAGMVAQPGASSSKYIATYDSDTETLTFEKYEGESLPSNSAWVKDGMLVFNEFFDLLRQKTIKHIVLNESFKTFTPTTLSQFFAGLTNLETITGLEYLNTANVTNMTALFYNCRKLTSLDLSNFNTAKVTDMEFMFRDCSNLKTIYASENFITAAVTYSNSMFASCNSLSGDIDWSDKAVDKTYAKIDGGYFRDKAYDNRPWVKYADGTLTFLYGYKKTLGENEYELNSGTHLPAWYGKSGNVTKAVFDASFANARPTSCYSWFCDFGNLKQIEGIENLNTTNVTEMASMFYGCSQLTSLDVTNFNTENVVWIMKIFKGCSALTTIYVSDKFVMAKVDDESVDMFKDCTNLKGAITEYDESKTDYHFANYKTGYFTKLVGKNGNEKIGAVGETLTAENLTLADDKDFVAYEPFAAKAASYSRTMSAGTTWASLCLPFEVSLANKNFRAFKLLSADDTNETVELEEIETSIAAGTPVIIKMNEGATLLSFSEANKAIAKDVLTSKTDNSNYQLQGLYTQKVFSKDADNNCYIVKGDKLMNPAKLLGETLTQFVGSKPFRAYMVDKSPAPAAGARMFSIRLGDGTTAIKQLEADAADTADGKVEYYDLQGHRLQDLQKGVNIVKRGGKTMKVVIK